jgi:hypothetical protein
MFVKVEEDFRVVAGGVIGRVKGRIEGGGGTFEDVD